MKGPAALSVMTAFRGPYDDEIDWDAGTIRYHYRSGSVDQADNRALRAAHEQRAPLIYFAAIAPGQYAISAPVFIVADDASARSVEMQAGYPLMDMRPDGPVSTADDRRYATREVRTRLHQHRFRHDVLHAYRHRCAICALREHDLVQAAHIVADPSPQGIAAVVNGLALCAIHHLAYDRNLLGIDPGGVVHIGRRLLDEEDGPMLRQGLQGFHGKGIGLPPLRRDHPDPERLEVRFAEFERATA